MKFVGFFGSIVAFAFSSFAFAAEMVASAGHEPVKAEIIKDDPADFIINVKFLANINDDLNAPTFAVYIASHEPKKCPDFRSLAIPYKSPTKYTREFNLADHPEVIDAINRHKCVIITNTAAK